MEIYYITDWLGLVPIFICMLFGVVGLIQLIKRKSLLKVDLDILSLGIYYMIVIFTYLMFEIIPINYRPILIEGFLEASYPSSLLSGEKVLSIAENENKSNLRSMCEFLFGIADMCSVLLVVLPLYPYKMEEYIYSVNLITYSEVSARNCMVYLVLFLALTALGLMKLILTKYKPEKDYKIMTDISMGLSILSVLFLAITRDAYAIIVAFLLLVIKGMVLLKQGNL